MFTTLLESGRAARWRPAHPAHPALSVVTHTAVIFVVTGASAPVVAPPRTVPEEHVTYVAPRLRVVEAGDASAASPRKASDPSEVPARAVRLRTPRGVPDRLPPVPELDVSALALPVIADVVDDPLDRTGVVPSAAELRSGATDAMLTAALKGYAPVRGSAADLYERGLVALKNNPAPTYPAQLLAAEVEGGVLIAFMVDTTGRADPRSVTVLRSTNELFTRAVRRVLPRLRYRPAQSGAAKIAILVEQQFIFQLR